MGNENKMRYTIKFRKFLFWRSYTVIGNTYDRQLDKMCLSFADGSQREIPGWSKYEVFVGPDWALAVKADLERKSGQAIPVNLQK